MVYSVYSKVCGNTIDTINVTIIHHTPEYHEEFWFGLFLLSIFILIYALKHIKSNLVNSEMKVQHNEPNVVIKTLNTIPTEYKPLPINHNIDMSQIGDINIKNEKIQ